MQKNIITIMNFIDMLLIYILVYLSHNIYYTSTIHQGHVDRDTIKVEARSTTNN